MSADAPTADAFPGVTRVIAEDIKFLGKLGIGEAAYGSLIAGRHIGDIVAVGGSATMAATVASSGVVASTFFGGGWLAALGLAGAATTPVGWVLGAAVVCAGAHYGVLRMFHAYRKSRVDSIPRFINTPLDLLAAALVDLIGALALKIATVDGHIDPRELAHIREYFIEEWGVDREYLDAAIPVLLDGLDKLTLDDMARQLRGYLVRSPDCDVDAIVARTMELVGELIEADGAVVEAERDAMRRVAHILKTGRPFHGDPTIGGWMARILASG
jgi:uncharacterized tellurite resistance protein B-like protein